MKRLSAILALVLAGLAFAARPCRYRERYYCEKTHPGPNSRYLTTIGGTVYTSGVSFTRSGPGAACTWADGGVTFPDSGVACVTESGYHARPQVVNLVSTDLTTWGKTLSPTVTGNAAVAPDGTATATEIQATVGGSHVSQTFIASASGGSYTCALYVKRAVAGTGSPALGFWDNTASMIVGTTANLTVSSAWARYSNTLSTTTAGHTIQCLVWPDIGGATGAVYAWMPQAETGSVADDACASGTCNAETATNPKPSQLSTSVGCVKACFTPSFTGANPLASVLSLVSGNTLGTARLLYVPASAQQFAISDGTHTATVAATFTAGTQVCAVGTWDSTAGKVTVQNLATTTTGSATGFTAFASFDSTLGLGEENSLKQPLGSGLSKVVFGSSPTSCQ